MQERSDWLRQRARQLPFKAKRQILVPIALAAAILTVNYQFAIVEFWHSKGITFICWGVFAFLFAYFDVSVNEIERWKADRKATSAEVEKAE